jgi:NADH:ubiquinone oxidoreductase subunit
MGFFKNLFTWWDGATFGTALFSWRNGRQLGEDALGNRYFEDKHGRRRWVMYAGSNDVSRVPPEWYAWLTRQIDDVPDKALPPPPKFLRTATPNLTGTADAYLPAGALERGGRRQAASGDYQPWTPD